MTDKFDSIVVEATLAKVQSMVDLSNRVTFDLQENSAFAMAELIEARRLGFSFKLTIEVVVPERLNKKVRPEVPPDPKPEVHPDPTIKVG